MISELEEATAAAPGPDGGFDLQLSERWGIGGGRLNGGYQLAAALRPLATVMAEAGRPDPVVASATFLRPALAGPAHLATTVHRVGRRLASGSAQLHQPGPDGEPREILRLEASFTDLATSPADRWDGDPAPQLPPPEECRDLLAGTAMRTDALVVGRVVFRVPELPGWRRGEPSGDPTAEFWVCFADGSDATLGSLAFVVDCATPVVADLGRWSSSTAVSFAAQAVASGWSDLQIAGGVQVMSRYPLMAGFVAGREFGDPDPWTGCQGWESRYPGEEVSQFRGAEMIADKWAISREEMEAFAYQSHQRALTAIVEGRFAREITPVGGVDVDEGPRADTTPEKMAGLKTLAPGGRLTAAVSSQISDGSAALLIASEKAVREHGLTPRARIHHVSARGDDPVMVLTAPVPATAYALERTGMRISDIDTVEINEAFASVVQAWLTETGADPAKVNPNGGAIALGHPIGATGARLMTTMLGELERTGGRWGLQTMCEGGGQANVTIIERT